MNSSTNHLIKILCFLILSTQAFSNTNTGTVHKIKKFNSREISSDYSENENMSSNENELIKIRNINTLELIKSTISGDESLSSKAKNNLEFTLFDKGVLVRGEVASRSEALKVLEIIFAIVPDYDVYNEMLY